MPGPYICKSEKGDSSVFAETVYRSNWRLSWQSPRLSTVVKDVDAFLKLDPDLEWEFPLSDSDPESEEMRNALKKIEKDFNLWRLTDPKEFVNRFAANASEFRTELEGLLGGTALIPGIGDNKENLFGSPPLAAENFHRGRMAEFIERSQRAEHLGGKKQRLAEDWKAGKGTLAIKEPKHYRPVPTVEKRKEGAPEAREAGSKAVETVGKIKEGAPEVLEAGLKAVDVAKAAADFSVVKVVGAALPNVITVGATMLATAAEAGLAAAGVLVEVGMSVAALVSLSSTAEHLRYLKKIRDKIDEFDPDKNCPNGDPRCFSARALIQGYGLMSTSRTKSGFGPFDADVHDLVAHQVLDYIIRKKETKRNRKTVASCALGTEVSAVKAVKGAKKALAGTKGVHRYKAAHWLAYHFCVCHCQLAMHMVAALTSVKEMYWLMFNGDYEGIADVLAEKMKSI
jgi:hypothetical protein